MGQASKTMVSPDPFHLLGGPQRGLTREHTKGSFAKLPTKRSSRTKKTSASNCLESRALGLRHCRAVAFAQPVVKESVELLA